MLLVIALVKMEGMVIWMVVPAAVDKTLNEKDAAKNHPVIGPVPPLPVIFIAFAMVELVSTVVYKGYETLPKLSLDISYTILAPQDSIG